jgi:hypothetical protein
VKADARDRRHKDSHRANDLEKRDRLHKNAFLCSLAPDHPQVLREREMNLKDTLLLMTRHGFSTQLILMSPSVSYRPVHETRRFRTEIFGLIKKTSRMTWAFLIK